MIKNITKGTVVSRTDSKLKGVNKFIGLMGREKAKTVIFKTKFGIHTFFVKFPIDVILVDKNKKVVVAKKYLDPNRIVIWNIRYDTVIELPAGSIKNSKTKKGDILDFKL